MLIRAQRSILFVLVLPQLHWFVLDAVISMIPSLNKLKPTVYNLPDTESDKPQKRLLRNASVALHHQKVCHINIHNI